jgi:hypothetical protein
VTAPTPDDPEAMMKRTQGHLDAECWCDLIPVKPHRVGDPHPAGTFDLADPPTPDQHWTRRWASRHVELLRQVADLTAERDALRRQVDAVKALHRRDGQGRKGRERCYHCHFAYPCPTVRAADPQRPARAPENAQEPRTPAPGSPDTPETLSGRLSAPDRGTE